MDEIKTDAPVAPVVDESVDTEAVKTLIQQSIDPAVKKIEAMATEIAEKFVDGVAAQRARAIETGKKVEDKHHDVTRDFLKALFRGDRDHMKNAGFVDTDGATGAGYTVPTELMAEVLRIAEKQYGLARRSMRYLPFSGAGNSRTIPTLGSTVSVAWTNEGAAKTSTKPTFSYVTQTLKKLAAIVPMTDEILEDSSINLTALVAELFAEAVAKEEDAQFFAGSGAPWTGILNNGSVNPVTMTASDIASLTADDLLDMIDATPSGALAGAKFYMHRSVLSIIRKLKASTSGEYVFSPASGGLPALIWDYPFETSDVFPTASALGAGDPAILFGNLQQAAIFGDKQQLRVKLLDQATVNEVSHEGSTTLNLAEQDMTAIRIVERVGYVLAVPTAVTVLSVGSGS